MTLEELINAAVIAVSTGDADEPDDDILARAEELSRQAFELVSTEYASDRKLRVYLTDTVSIPAVLGVYTLPTNVMPEYLDDARFEDPARPDDEYSYCRRLSDYRSASDGRLGYWHVRNSTELLFTQPTAVETAPDPVEITAVFAIPYPATAATVISFYNPERILQTLILLLAPPGKKKG